ncbi:MAG TPA: TadE/TadG family type IV pilus assembly protein [Tepidisphaeraceae bacterium]|nr:TadE/TadG family type IV pilus assembly protein [Tepidisphaeraceae bacterium]
MRFLKRFKRGSAVMEAALVFPVLLSLTFGSIEFGHFFYYKHTLQGAAREGARAAIVPGATNANVTTAVTSAMSAAGIASNRYDVVIRTSSNVPSNLYTMTNTQLSALTDDTVSSIAAGSGVSVIVWSNWGTVGVRPVGVLSSSKNVIGETVMRKEG